MPEPVTIGVLAACALGMAADGVSKGLLGEIGKDAYKSLKEKVVQWAGSDVAALEKTPASESRRAVVAEVIDQQSENDRESLRGSIETLIDQLKQNSQTIGLDITTLTNVETELRNITVTRGIGARINQAAGGKLVVDNINVGPSRKK